MSKITIKLFELKQILDSLESIIKKDIPMPIKLSYRLGKLLKIIAKEFEEYEEQRMKLAIKYSKKDEEGQPIVDENNSVNLPEDKINDFNKEFIELSNIDLEIDFKPISLDEFGDVNISLKDLHFLVDKFIVDDNEDNKENKE